MPLCDGPTCCRKIKQLLGEQGSQGGNKMPFICMVTAYQEKAFREVAIEQQVDLFMVKPI
eukprot:CAMPEP_0185606958 /NCGR_PEP_ID=MMETSP0436-20130131/5167_1 /TAXON_ID=626734 ORGANISM="Favella taraikaensis, Strain Fe Narragansett Bay" /NCGR_SAMPLE_ID=MMETSP0436 /ASSEMBLY_ACC=CAM_ASM_000390 /LENGTH=59 /DNA_ID=CAMNT_0028238715 /DNA_START=938 /DNA_END=1114 /DNA_ORIENTATION=+